MPCILSYLFFKKPFIYWFVVNNTFKPSVALENLVFQNANSKWINICFISRFTANLLIVIADRIARVLKTSGATQVVVLDISKAFCRVWDTGRLYKFKLYSIMEISFIFFSHIVVVKDFELFLSTSHLLICH